MSSHHIVREKQEPALLILSLEGFEDELLGQLLEWSPTLITTPLTAEQVNSLGIKVDVIITDEPDTVVQSDVKVIAKGGQSATQAALVYLITAGYTSVNIILSEMVLNDLLAYADQINLVVFCRDQKIFPVRSGFSKWKPAGEEVVLLSRATNLITDGLTDNGDGKYLTQHDGFYLLNFDEPFAFVAEYI